MNSYITTERDEMTASLGVAMTGISSQLVIAICIFRALITCVDVLVTSFGAHRRCTGTTAPKVPTASAKEPSSVP